MKNAQPVIQKTGWGDAKKVFNEHLPAILDQLNAGKTRRQIHQNLNAEISYAQFCEHLKRHLNSLSLPIEASSGSSVTITAGSSVAGSRFSIPKVFFGDEEDEGEE